MNSTYWRRKSAVNTNKKRITPGSLLTQLRGSELDNKLKELRETRRVLQSYRIHVAHTGDTSFPELEQRLSEELHRIQGDLNLAVESLEAIQAVVPDLISAVLARLERLAAPPVNQPIASPLLGLRAKATNAPLNQLLIAEVGTLTAKVLEADAIGNRHGVSSRLPYLCEFLMAELTSSRLGELLQRGGSKEALLRRPKLYLQELVGELETVKNHIAHMRQ